MWRRVAAYLWASPNTLLGLVIGMVGCLGGGHWRLEEGILEAEGPLLAWLLRRGTPRRRGVEALTLGHVVLGRSDHCLHRCRAHERIHVRQYEIWGPAFLAVYLASSLWQWAKGGHPYWDNRFEREAFALAPIEPE